MSLTITDNHHGRLSQRQLGFLLKHFTVRQQISMAAPGRGTARAVVWLNIIEAHRSLSSVCYS